MNVAHSPNEVIICHHGILGQRWGVRRFQNPDGTLTPAGRRRLKRIEKKDSKWVDKHYDKIYKKAYKPVKKEYNQLKESFERYIKSGKGTLSRTTINRFNQKLADILNSSSVEITAPSGRVVKFVAKRAEIGLLIGLADKGYDMDRVKNGVYEDGRIAYKKTKLSIG